MASGGMYEEFCLQLVGIWVIILIPLHFYVRCRIQQLKVFTILQLLLFVPLSTALCEFGYTLDQGAGGEPVAQYQYVSPVILALSMVSE